MPILFAEGAGGWLAWPPDNLGEALFATTVFGLIGIALAIFGFKMFDKMTPGNLQEEILQNKNVAAAVLAGSFIVGICIIVAAVVG